MLEEYLVVHQVSATPHPPVLDTVRFCMLREAHQNMFLITIMRLSVSAALVSILKTMILERENVLHP